MFILAIFLLHIFKKFKKLNSCFNIYYLYKNEYITKKFEFYYLGAFLAFKFQKFFQSI